MIAEPKQEIKKMDTHLQAHLAALVQSSDDAIISKTMDGIIIYWNNAAEKIFGYKSEEVLGKSINILAPHETDEHKAILEKFNKGEKLEHYETKRIKKDGTEIDVSLTVSPIFDDQKTIVGFSTIARDVSKRAQKEMQSHLQAHLADIVQSSDDAIISKSMDGIIIYWNDAAEKIFGYKSEEMLGKSINLLAPHKTDEHNAILEKFNKGEKLEHYETKRIKKDGSIIDISLTVSPIYDHNKKVVGFSTIARDVTK